MKAKSVNESLNDQDYKVDLEEEINYVADMPQSPQKGDPEYDQDIEDIYRTVDEMGIDVESAVFIPSYAAYDWHAVKAELEKKGINFKVVELDGGEAAAVFDVAELKGVNENMSNDDFFAQRDEMKEGFKAKYPQIREVARSLEAKLGIQLDELPTDDLGDELALREDGEEIACLIFDVIDRKVKQDEDNPLALVIDEDNGFQFYAGPQPLATSAHSKQEENEMYQSLIPAHIDVALLTKPIYDRVVKDYKRLLNDYA